MSQILPLLPSPKPPASPVSEQRFTTTLGETQYGFRLRWNSRDESWYMDVSRADGKLIACGIRVVLGTLLGGRVVDPDFPPGGFRAVDLSNRGQEATLYDLGERVAVYYLTPEELIAS